MNAPSFYSAYELKIDPKNRVVIPADVRRVIDPEAQGVAMIAALGSNGLPWLYPEATYQSLMSQIPLELSPDDPLLDYIHRKFSLSIRLLWDEIGRILLPEKMIRQCKILRDVSMIGAGDHLEIWNRDAWEARCDFLSNQGALVDLKGKMAIKAARTAAPTV